MQNEKCKTKNDAARGLLLRQLEETDFMPPADWDGARRLAGQIEGGRELDGLARAVARRAEQDSLRAEVEAFAAGLFSLSPAARTAQYQQLRKRCSDAPAAVNRLEALRDAFILPCELPADQPPDVLEVLSDIKRLFVLPPAERAHHRLATINRRRGDRDRWRRPARLIQAKFPRYAALEPALLSELAAPVSRAQVREKIARRRRRAADPGWPTRVVRAARRLPASVWVLIVFFSFGLFAGLSEDPNERSAPPPAPQPFGATRAMKETEESLNKALREGKPIDDTLRRLYRLPPQKKSPSRREASSSPPERSPPPHERPAR